MRILYQKRSHRGFTIIETLVAITILMIAIAGPLTAANKGYTASLDARNQAIASNLAQEGMEELNNMKDNAIANGGAWPPSAWNSCTSLTADCGIQLSSSGNPTTVSLCTTTSCALTLSDTNLGYTYNPGTATPFFRQFYWMVQPDSGQILVTVVVSWTTGTTPNQVQLQEILSNASR